MKSGRFDIQSAPLSGLAVAVRNPIEDSRGWLERMFCAEDLRPLTGKRAIAQINRTMTKKAGTVRGLHFQRSPAAEMKLVSCLRGEVYDVAVDLRRRSPTFLNWYGEVLSSENRRTMVIPEGFAHGFETLTSDCELLYLHTMPYAPALEEGLDATDPQIGIQWPVPISFRSCRDEAHPRLTSDFKALDE